MNISFQQLFIESKGQPIQYKGKEIKMIDKVYLPADKVSLQLEFVSTDSKWEQGIVLQTNGVFEINRQKFRHKIILWEHTAPTKIEITITSKEKILIIYNVWATGDGTIHYWHNGGALFIEKTNDVTVYYCNDGFPDDDFDDLIFKLKFGIIFPKIRQQV